MTQARPTLPLLLLLVLPAASCHDSDASKPAKSAAPAQAAPKASAAPATAPTPTPPPPPPAPPADDSCTIRVTGAVTGEGVGRGGMMAVDASAWHTAEERARKGALFGKHEGVLINCNVPNLTTTIEVSSGDVDLAAARAAVPFGPHRYAFAGLQKGSPRVHLMATLEGKSIGTSQGVVDLTAFDTSHVAGTFTATGPLLGGGEVTIEGKFSFRCPGYQGCQR